MRKSFICHPARLLLRLADIFSTARFLFFDDFQRQMVFVCDDRAVHLVVTRTFGRAIR
jgi:hypothetical protein